jgi:hypothetical protein
MGSAFEITVPDVDVERLAPVPNEPEMIERADYGLDYRRNEHGTRIAEAASPPRRFSRKSSDASTKFKINMAIVAAITR